MTFKHRMGTRRYPLVALALAGFWLGAAAAARAGDSWSPRVAISDEKGGRHEGTLEGFVLELKGHPTVAPTEQIELNGVAQRTPDLTGIRLTWTASPVRGDDALAVTFEFADGSVVEPRMEKEGPAPVTSLSFTFAEEGRGRLEWSYRTGQPNRSPLGRVGRIDVVAKAKGNEGKGDQGKGDEGKGGQGKGDEGRGDQGKGDAGKGDQGKGDEGKGDEGKGEQGEGDQGKGEQGKGDQGKGDEGKGEQGKGDQGKGDEGKGETGGLYVLIFDDANGNGQRDRGEAELAGWEYKVAGPDGVASHLVTPPGGSVTAQVPAGRYTVASAGREGWTATTPATQTAIVPARGKVSVAFGNRRGEQSGPSGKCNPLPPQVVVDPAACDCHLGALPLANEIILRWSLCPAAISVVDGEPRLYRTNHGAGVWQRVAPSSGVPGVLKESSLELASLHVSLSDQELFRDLVRHYKKPGEYVETPLPTGKTAAQAADDVRDLAYIALVTRFGLTLNLMEAMGLGIVDATVSNGSLYDYVLTMWTPQVEKLCCRVDNVGPLAPPAAPAPTNPGAEALRTRMPDLPGARRPDCEVTPIGLTWTSPPPVPNPPSPGGASQIHTECSPLSPAPPYAEGTFNVVAYVIDRKDGNGPWTRLGDGPIVEVERTDAQIALTGTPPPAPAAYRYLDIATEDHHTYAYHISSLDLLGRTSAPTADVSATAYAIPSPIPWKTFTASWNVDQRHVDVVLTLKAALPTGRQLWVERTCPTPADSEAGLVRLNANLAWTGSAPSFSLADAGVAEKTRYDYKIVIDEPAAGGTIEMNLRAAMVVPDLTPPDPLPPLQFVLRPATPLPDAVTKALSDQTLLDQDDKAKWDAAVQEVRGEIADELAKLQPMTQSSTETVTLEGACQKIEVSLDELEGAVPDFAGERLPYPPQAELVYSNGERLQGRLEELDLDGPSLSCHLLPDRAPIGCDGRSIPWDLVNSISLLWRVSQPRAAAAPRLLAFPWITDTHGEVAFPKAGPEPVSLKKIHVKLAAAAGSVTWNFDVDKQVPGARQIRSVRLLDTPWRIGTPGETFCYLWSDPDRIHSPEGEVTKVEIDQTAAPGRKATVTGTPFPGPLAANAWTVHGHLVSLGVVTAGGKEGVRYPLNGNSPGQRVTIGAKEYSVDDLIRVEIVWASSGKEPSPTRVTLTFHHPAELRTEDLPTWPDADVKARALTKIETKRMAPYMPDILASREGVILYWSYAPPANPSELAGFNVYRATGDAPTVFTRINAEPVPITVASAGLGSPPAGWPPASAGPNLCWFEDHLLGGVGSQYWYQVTALDDTGIESSPNPPTGLLVSIPDRAGPPAPVLVSVKKEHSNAGAVEVRIEWRAPQHPYDVVVYRKEAGSNAPATAVHTATQANPATSFVDAGPFLPLKSYEYFLRGDSGGTLGKPSGTRTVQIQSEDVPPVVSTPLTAVAAPGKVTLSWGAPTLPSGVTVARYVLERREAGAAAFRLREANVMATTFVDTRVTSGKTYEYRVVLIDSNDATWLSAYAPASVLAQ